MLIIWDELKATGIYNEVTRTYDNKGRAGYISKGIMTFNTDVLDVETT